MSITLDVLVLIIKLRQMSAALMTLEGFHVLTDVMNSVEVHVEKRGGLSEIIFLYLVCPLSKREQLCGEIDYVSPVVSLADKLIFIVEDRSEKLFE